MTLAVGCDEGELILYDMATNASTDIQPPQSTVDTDTSTAAIVSMQWVQLQSPITPFPIVKAPFSQPFKSQNTTDQHSTSHVLITANKACQLRIWWTGTVLIAVVNLSDQYYLTPTSKITSLQLSSDLSFLYVGVHSTASSSTDSHLIRLNLINIRSLQPHLTHLSTVAHTAQQLLPQFNKTTRQLQSEVCAHSTYCCHFNSNAIDSGRMQRASLS